MTEADRGELIPREPSTVRRRLAPREMRVVREPQRHSLDGAFVVVGVTVHNAADSIRRCLASVLQQKTGPFPIATLILDDSSTDGWEEKCQDLIEALDACVVRAHCGSPSHARNAVLDFVQRSCPHVDWVARLDADDRLSTPDSLGIMCEATDPEARFVLGGNRLVCRGQLLGRPTPPPLVF